MSEYPDIGQLASLARTALDDPASLPRDARWWAAGHAARQMEKVDVSEWHEARDLYAIARLDEIIGLVEYGEPSHAATLAVAGRIVAAVADRFIETEHSELGGRLHEALDVVDEAMGYLEEYPDALLLPPPTAAERAAAIDILTRRDEPTQEPPR